MICSILQVSSPKHTESSAAYTGRKLLDTISSLSDAVSSVTLTPSQQVIEWINNQVIPDYWIPDSDILVSIVYMYMYIAVAVMIEITIFMKLQINLIRMMTCADSKSKILTSFQ